jgi:hypothetical protein
LGDGAQPFASRALLSPPLSSLSPLSPLPSILNKIELRQALKTTPKDQQTAAEKGLPFVFSDFCAICAI